MEKFPKSNHTELVSSFQERDFAAKVFNQLQREFQKIGLEVDFEEADYSSYESFLEKLEKELSLVLDHSPSLFQQLLYISDLPEHEIANIFSEAPNPTQEISKLLLIRIARKVYYQNLYKQGKL